VADKRSLEEDYLSIGELAEIYNISPRTLRLYHDMGLLAPCHIDVLSGYRYYSQKQLPRLEVVIQMKALSLYKRYFSVASECY